MPTLDIFIEALPPTMQIESREKKVLGHIQFVPWQDGAYLRTIKMPLEPFLFMIKKKVPLMTIPQKGSTMFRTPRSLPL